MAMTGYYKTLVRPRQHRPLSMLKYDPVGMYPSHLVRSGRERERARGEEVGGDKGVWGDGGTERSRAGDWGSAVGELGLGLLDMG